MFAPRLAEHYDLQVSSFYGLEGAPIIWNGIPILPGLGLGTYGDESIPHHVDKFFGDQRNGMVFTLLDVWTLNARVCSQFNMASWTPIDHDPPPPKVAQFFRESQAIPVAMSRFGQERLEEFDPLYVPHAVDTDIFKPVEGAREQIGIDPDEFVVGIVAANKGYPSRKCFAQALEAFAHFYRGHTNARLYLHTDVEGAYSQGVPLRPLIDALGIPEHAVRVVDPYRIYFNPIPPHTMAALYSTMDVLLNVSAGEGFGITVLEAQACGVPAIVTDFSAMTEVCGAGWRVKYGPTWTAQNSWQATPLVADIVDSLNHLYSMPTAARAQLSAKARVHALKYDVGVVTGEHFLPALEAVQERFEDRRPLAAAA